MITTFVTQVVPGKSLLFGILSALLAGFGAPASADPHLGRSPGADDAVTADPKLRQDRPAVVVRVTNPTGRPLLLRGWLDGEEASAVVPEQSAMVTLSWERAGDGELVLELYPDAAGRGGVVDREVHRAVVRDGDHYYGPGIPSSAASPAVPRSGGEVPARNTVVSVSDQAPAVVPTVAPVVVPVALPVTGMRLEPYVLVGGGLLGFGLLVLGLSWILSRRSPTD